MKALDKMTIEELKELNVRVEAAMVKARDREVAELREEFAKMATSRGLSVSDLFGAKAVLKKSVKAKYRNPDTGDTWTGRGRAPRWMDIANKDRYAI